MIAVYVWDFLGKDRAWGHASMHVEQTYVSWWPQGEGRVRNKVMGQIYHANPIRGRTYQDDVRDEQRQPDHVIHLAGLDEAAVKDWWRGFGLMDGDVSLVGPMESWHTLKRNCSTVVATGLKRGGGDRYASWARSWNLVWTPEDVRNFALAIASGLHRG